MSVVHDRLLDAAAALTVEQGWAALTMGKLAERVGVSRQTVYNSIGGKADLAEALVMRELARFLEAVEHELSQGDDVVDAFRRTVRRVLELAEGNALLKSALSASHGKDADELLPLLTTHSSPLLAAATETVEQHLHRFELALGPQERQVAIETVVRVVLSHVMQPTASPARTADDLAWITGRVLSRPGELAARPSIPPARV